MASTKWEDFMKSIRGAGKAGPYHHLRPVDDRAMRVDAIVYFGLLALGRALEQGGRDDGRLNVLDHALRAVLNVVETLTREEWNAWMFESCLVVDEYKKSGRYDRDHPGVAASTPD